MATQYSTERFTEAHNKFFEAPTTLTEADCELFDLVHAEFAARAQAARAGYVEPAQPRDRAPVPGAVSWISSRITSPRSWAPIDTSCTRWRHGSRSCKRAR
jgi:hypothetical protein